ncbi:thioredoxin-like protein, partial [Polychytrium aggregatum]|uniref:thioredoxin-like protein n=1 Tax=Polychytrium aggregatum TaxID=110093 RepID=UPI0022FEC077
GAVIEAGDKDLDTILSETEESSTVIVDFYADWCGPCRVLAPILAQAVKENGKTFLVKVNVDVHEETAAKYQIASLPTVAAFRNGKIVGTFIGSRDKNFVGKFI